MKKSRLFLIFLAISFAVVMLNGCSTGDANSKDGETENVANADSNKTTEEGNKNGPGMRNAPSAVPVEVTTLTRGNISNFLQYSSTLETEQIVDVYPRIGGLVEAIYVEEGQRVNKGQRLVQIEKDEYELAEQKARLEFEKQESEFKRFKALQAEELLSQEEFFSSEIAYKQAEIAWKQASLNLQWTTVTSPISGVVGERLVNLGDRVQAANNLFQIANLDEKIVQVYVPQDEFTQIFKNQPATVSTGILDGERFPASVKRISPIIDPQSGTFKVTVAVKDPAGRLRPGMFVNTELIVDTHENTPLAPKAALIYENERTYFFVVKDDTSRRMELKKGFEDAEKVEILNDLEEGSKIVVLGQNGLKEGTKVKIIEEKRYAWQPSKPSATITESQKDLAHKG